MTSRDFIGLTARFIESSAPFEYLLSLLLVIAEAHESLSGDVSGLAAVQDNSNHVVPAHLRLTTKLRGVSERVRNEFESRKVWAGVEDLGRRVRDLAESEFAQEVGEKVATQLSRFSEIYEQFLKTYSVETTFILVDRGNDLYQTLDSMRTTAVLAEKALLPSPLVGDGETELDLSFSSAPTLAEFAAKVTALAEIYQKLCELFTVSTATSPLRIVKIETGTWAAKVIGSLPVIGLMTRLIESAALYWYRNHTAEGKFSMLPRKAEAVEAVLNLKKMLDQANIDTSAMDANIQGASVVLAQDLNTLLGGEPRIVINATEVTGMPELTGVQLHGGRELLENAPPRGDQLPPPSASNEAT